MDHSFEMMGECNLWVKLKDDQQSGEYFKRTTRENSKDGG